jgi:hypothetical protein
MVCWPTTAHPTQASSANIRGNVLESPGVVELTLPSKDELKIWTNLDPLEQGVQQFPPSLEDSNCRAASSPGSD